MLIVMLANTPILLGVVIVFLLIIFSQYTMEGSVKATNVIFQSRHTINHAKNTTIAKHFSKV